MQQTLTEEVSARPGGVGLSTLPLPPGLTTDGLQPTLGGSPTPAGEHVHTVPT